MCPEVKNAIEGAIFIANHLKEEDEFNRVSIPMQDGSMLSKKKKKLEVVRKRI